MEKGLIHIYCGDGKGKTTAALGLGLRAWGRGFKVILVQFLKSSASGEIEALSGLENYTILRGKKGSSFSFAMSEEERKETEQMHNENLQIAIELAYANACDLLILDEGIGAVNRQLLDRKMLFHFIRNKPEKLEIVLTGRNPDQEFLELADYVTEMKKIKHPYDQGLGARVGVEK